MKKILGNSMLTTPALIIIVIVVWDLGIRVFNVSPIIMPLPGDVGSALLDALFSWNTYVDFSITVSEVLLGFGVAIVSGISLGALLAKSPTLSSMLHPFIIALQVTPKTPFVPLMIVWFGFGMTSKVIIAALLAFFPVFTNTFVGIRSAPGGLRDVGSVLRLSPVERFKKIEFPYALPTILTGLEVAIVLAITGAIVGEFLGGSEGLGYQTVAAMNAFDTPRLFAIILLLAVMGFLLHFGVMSLRKWLVPWHESAKKIQV